jgi:hypothetical protein
MANYIHNMVSNFKVNDDVIDKFVKNINLDEENFINFILEDTYLVQLVAYYYRYFNKENIRYYSILYIILEMYHNFYDINVELPVDLYKSIIDIKENIDGEYFETFIKPYLLYSLYEYIDDKKQLDNFDYYINKI